ncbi:hypothetical protein ACFY8O_31180 [Streptomyces argenteolus]|uniref:Secreted protein n=1 Tax=Streptomyces argenteolus TaxID=67274 RepID=A0ABW6XF61_9ACTN
MDNMDRLPRTGALIAAALTVALSLTACGGGGDDEATGTTPSARSGSPRSTAPAADDSAETVEAAKALEGTWTGGSKSDPVALSVTSGKAALIADRHVCQGEVKHTGEVVLALKCLDGNTDRARGTVESNDGGKLVLSWEDGTEDTLTRTPTSTASPALPTP